MADKARGLYQKYRVERTDGTSKAGGKHFGCRYFVLDLDHDRHAAPALRAYADSCEGEYPLLSRDLRLMADAMLAARDGTSREQPALSASEGLLRTQLRIAINTLKDEADMLEQWAEREREDEWRRFVERADALRRLVATLERTLGGGR